MAKREKCQATRTNGEPCRAPAIYERDGLRVCQIHSLTPEQRLAQQSKGGRTKARTKLPLDYEVASWLLGLVVSVVNVSWNAREIADNFASVCGLSERAPERVEIEQLLSRLAGFERRHPPTEADRSAVEVYLRHGIENGYLDKSKLSPELQALVAG